MSEILKSGRVAGGFGSYFKKERRFFFIGIFFHLLSVMANAESKQEIVITYNPNVQSDNKLRQVTVCKDAPYDTSASTTVPNNEARNTFQEILGGSITAIQVHYYSSDWKDFDEVSRYLRAMLASRPKGMYRYTAWDEGTRFNYKGIIGSVEFGPSRAGVLEVAGGHLCAQDEKGTYWWTRDIPDTGAIK